MRAGETALQMCIRHVAEQETRIARQEALIDDARRLLGQMHDLLGTMREHAARLLK
jgi:hypothetical protein